MHELIGKAKKFMNLDKIKDIFNNIFLYEKLLDTKLS